MVQYFVDVYTYQCIYIFLCCLLDFTYIIYNIHFDISYFLGIFLILNIYIYIVLLTLHYIYIEFHWSFI